MKNHKAVVAAIFLLFSGISVMAETARLEISANGKIFWPGAIGQDYWVTFSADLKVWHKLFRLETNAFAIPLTNGGIRFYRIMDLPPITHSAPPAAAGSGHSPTNGVRATLIAEQRE